MPELEFRVEGELSERLEQWRKENRTRAPSTSVTSMPGKLFGLSLKSALLIVAVAVTLHAVIQRRSAVSLDSFAPSSTRNAAPTGGEAFGTTSWVPHALKGEVYLLPQNTSRLPDFATMQSVRTIYTAELNITPRAYTDGYPGVTDRTEWYGIVYTGILSIAREGNYRFSLTSDDGARLFIDGARVIDYDGTHAPDTKKELVQLNRGPHNLRIEYFQGPRGGIALVLEIKRE